MSKKKLNGHALLLRPFPEELHKLPGMLQAVADFGFTSRAHRDTRVPATMAALLTTSILSGNRFAVFRNGTATPLALGVVIEMATGSGKEVLQGAVGAVLRVAGADKRMLNVPASGPALIKAMAEGERRIVYIDEIGRVLAAINEGQDTHKASFLTEAMSLYAKAFDVYLPKKYATAKDDVPPIQMPYLCIAGMTTATELDKALTGRDVKNGFLNRLLVVRTMGEKGDSRDPDNLSSPSMEIAEWAMSIAAGAHPDFNQPTIAGGLTATGRADLIAKHPAAFDSIFDVPMRRIVLDAKAEAAFLAFRTRGDEAYRSDSEGADLWARAPEHVLRIAGLLAIGRATTALLAKYEPLRIVVSDIEYASKLVTWCVENMTTVAITEMAAGVTDRAKKKIVQALAAIAAEPPTSRKAKERGWDVFNKAGWVPHAQLIERVSRNAPDLDRRFLNDALEMLESTMRVTQFDANSDLVDPRDEDTALQLPEGLTHAMALEMSRRAAQSNRSGGHMWYRLADE